MKTITAKWGEVSANPNSVRVIKSRQNRKQQFLLLYKLFDISVIIIFVTFLCHPTPFSCQISKSVLWYFSILLQRRKRKNKNTPDIYLGM